MVSLSPAARRRLASAAIVLFWAAMGGLLAWKELRTRRAPEGGTGAALPAVTDTWLGIFMAGDRPVGTLHVSSRPERHQERPGVTLRLDGRMRAKMLDMPVELEADGWLWRADGEPRAEFEARVASADHQVRVTGHIVNDELRARVTSGGETLPVRLPVDRSLLASDALLWRFPKLTLRPGQETSLEAFDPLSGRAARVHVSCLREEAIVSSGARVHTRVVTVTTGHAVITAWLADDGEVVQADTPFGLSVRRISRAEALAMRRTAQGPEMVGAMRILPSGVRPMRGARRMVVRLDGLPTERAWPTDDTQRLGTDGRSLLIDAPHPPQRPEAAATSEAIASGLGCNAFVQCDHPKIREQAARIAAGEADPWQRAVRIERWVHENLTKRVVFSFPSALDVLATREGDCTEHTVLFTALARAAGVPTRQIAGLVWSEAVQGFAYHAWPEVYVGRWIWIDPTFGQEIADATHIRLHTGDESWQDALVSLGRLQIEVTEVK